MGVLSSQNDHWMRGERGLVFNGGDMTGSDPSISVAVFGEHVFVWTGLVDIDRGSWIV